MKAFIVLAAVVAAVAADADPQVFLAGKPCTNAYGAAVPCAQGHPVFANTYAAYGARPFYHHGLYKREAEADADAQFVTPYGYAGYGVPAVGYHVPSVYGVGLVAKPCTNEKGEAVECAHGTHANVYAVPTVHALGKRDADAKAAYAFTGYSQFPLRGYHPYASHGLTHTSQLGFCTNYLGQAVPC